MQFYTSPGSGEVEIFKDSIKVKTVDLKNNVQLPLLVSINADDSQKVKISIRNKGLTTNPTKFVYIRSVGYSDLADITVKEITAPSIHAKKESSYTHTKGASDFGIYDSDDSQYCLSYHGGEEEVIPMRVLGDAKELSALEKINTFAKRVDIIQRTKLVNDRLNIETTHSIVDNGYLLNVAMSGDINTSTFYTFMNTTHPRFRYLKVPFVATLTTNDLDLHEYLGSPDIGVVIQSDGEYSVESRFTLFKDSTFYEGKNNGVYIRKNPAYLKLYYGLHKCGTNNPFCKPVRTVKKIKFNSVRIYR